MDSIGIEGGGVATGGGAQVPTADLLSLVYEASTGFDLTGLVDLGGFGQRQFEQLQEALLAKGEALTDADKEAFERGEPEKIRQVLKRIRLRTLETAARARPNAPGDGITRSSIPALSTPAAFERLPSGEVISVAEILHLVYEEPGDGAPPRLGEIELWGPQQIRELTAALLLRGEKLSVGEAKSLAAGEVPQIRALVARVLERRQAADRAFAGKQRAARKGGFARLLPSAPQDAPKQLEAARQRLLELVTAKTAKHRQTGVADNKLLGKVSHEFAFANGFPTTGRSGEAHTLPALQFLPEALRKVAAALGIRTLLDFLVRAMGPGTRSLTAGSFGVSAPTLLLAAYRAELLDLPVKASFGKQPHLKDVLLLARVGAGSIHALARLDRLFTDSPVRLELLASLLGQLQKARPAYIGRERIMRQDLREWATAATRRGSEVTVRTARTGDPATEVESAAERIVSWYLEHRWEDPEAPWHEMLARLLVLMRLEGVRVADGTWKRLLVECGRERLIGYLQLAERDASDIDAARREEEMRRYADYLLDERDPSIFFELAPLLGPDTERTDRLICFWIDPVADSRHVVRAGGVAGDALPESIKPVYVCLDPDSGAVVPFGG